MKAITSYQKIIKKCGPQKFDVAFRLKNVRKELSKFKELKFYNCIEYLELKEYEFELRMQIRNIDWLLEYCKTYYFY